MVMETIRCAKRTEVAEVDGRLAEMELDRESLIAAGTHALMAAAGADPLHPANAAGFFAYADGVRGIRAEIIGGNWTFFAQEGVEGIENKKLRLRVLFANVVSACGRDDPQARSRKGAGSERVACGDMFDAAGIELPVTVVKFHGDFRTYYLMVDESGSMELSFPVVKNGKFLRCVERIFLIDGDELDKFDIDLDEPDNDPGPEIVVTKK